MKTTNVLIPTDLTVISLKVIPALIQQQPDTKFNITLVNFLGLSDSITELLMLSRRSREYEHITQEYIDECTRLVRTYGEQIENLNTEFFYGNTVAVFKNFLEARQFDQIAKMPNHRYEKINENSYDPDRLLERSGCKVIDLLPSRKQEPANAKASQSVENFELQRV